MAILIYFLAVLAVYDVTREALTWGQRRPHTLTESVFMALLECLYNQSTREKS